MLVITKANCWCKILRRTCQWIATLLEYFTWLGIPWQSILWGQMYGPPISDRHPARKHLVCLKYNHIDHDISQSIHAGQTGKTGSQYSFNLIWMIGQGRLLLINPCDDSRESQSIPSRNGWALLLELGVIRMCLFFHAIQGNCWVWGNAVGVAIPYIDLAITLIPQTNCFGCRRKTTLYSRSISYNAKYW